MSKQEKYTYNSALGSQEGKRQTILIKDSAVKTNHIANKAVTPEKLSDSVLTEFVMPSVNAKIANLQNQIDSLEISGLALSNEFGNDPHIGISQKKITEAINDIWAKIEDITGEQLIGFDIVATPNYFIGEDGATVHIVANTIGMTDIFEHIALYANGTLLVEQDNVNYLEYDMEIDETTVFSCQAKVLGMGYTRQAVVTHYNSFWLGAGDTYADVMNVGNIIPIENGMRGSYNVTCGQGKHIIIIVADDLRAGFYRADMNGFEIPFTETTVTVDDKLYKVLTSTNVYQADTYNIDING